MNVPMVISALTKLQHACVQAIAALEAAAPELPHPGQVSDQALAESIMAMVSDFYRLSPAAIAGPSKRSEVVEARWAAIFLIQRHTRLSESAIGRILKRNSTTVGFALKQFADRQRLDKRLAERVRIMAVRVEAGIPQQEA